MISAIAARQKIEEKFKDSLTNESLWVEQELSNAINDGKYRLQIIGTLSYPTVHRLEEYGYVVYVREKYLDELYTIIKW